MMEFKLPLEDLPCCGDPPALTASSGYRGLVFSFTPSEEFEVPRRVIRVYGAKGNKTLLVEVFQEVIEYSWEEAISRFLRRFQRLVVSEGATVTFKSSELARVNRFTNSVGFFTPYIPIEVCR